MTNFEETCLTNIVENHGYDAVIRVVSNTLRAEAQRVRDKAQWDRADRLDEMAGKVWELSCQ